MKGQGSNEMKPNETNLTAKMQKALAALLDNPKVEDAARVCGVTRITLWRYMQDEHFQTEYRAAQRLVVDSAISELQAATSEAVQTLKRNLKCGSFSAENMAAQAILSHSMKALEVRELIERVDRLEKVYAARGVKTA
jgi:predicted DNA-binding transcriptional regulator AlpA